VRAGGHRAPLRYRSGLWLETPSGLCLGMPSGLCLKTPSGLCLKTPSGLCLRTLENRMPRGRRPMRGGARAGNCLAAHAHAKA
jgi:hypothetical protein